MKKILITGVSGFIGSNLKNFIGENYPFYDIYGIDISLDKSTEQYFKVDLNNQRLVKSIIKKIMPDYIFHLAGVTKTEDFSELIQKNVIATNSLLDSILSLKNYKTRIIIPGSSAEYGKVPGVNIPIKETAPLKPINSYGFSKMCQTLLALSYQKKRLDIVIGRIFNIIGWGTPTSFSIGKFTHDISIMEKAQKKAIIKTESLNSKRDFLDIKDVCSGLVAIAEKGRSGEVYNICSSKSYKIKSLLNHLIKLSNYKDFKTKSFCLSKSPEVKNIRGSNEKIRRDTGWYPKIRIFESLKNTLDYYWQLSK